MGPHYKSDLIEPQKQAMLSIISGQSSNTITSHDPSYDLDYLINAVRVHLGMDVAFLSRFHNGQREIYQIDINHDNETALKSGHTDLCENTYCQLIVDKILPEIIPDTSLNDITKHLSITHQLNIGSYIGVPIVFSDESVYGTLCCFSEKPDPTLSLKDLSLMKLFAKVAARNLEERIKQNTIKQTLRNQITTIFQNQLLSIVFQPIYDIVKKRVLGFECLSRFNIEPIQSPDYWFDLAEQAGLGEELEMFAIETALKHLEYIPDCFYITLNISPKHLYSERFRELFDTAPLHRIVLEVTEREVIDDYRAFQEALKPFRRRGMRLAVDDAGAGFASFHHILELQADIIKLDRSLISNVNADNGRRALITALTSFAKETNSKVLGEGVETQEESDTLKYLGVEKIQGYYLCHPVPLSEALTFSFDLNKQNERKAE
ncbi:Putative cyclic-di-GMP phosphodiesterase AdrB [Marinomonas spartinae]|uniref:Putative cyclic-di-GMP phosphodiesterase AdrB n=1 Tax=Marinomonas spartinae TaxID=1792290 RepID=A0A1A8TFX5_9GAMM|nr:EAL domain-containing protein [Marinomonas spartinae]SBS30834.1 Putative cyclic-di-GMP phosphodiesterase AdrB [Marinomonas spartinae]